MADPVLKFPPEQKGSPPAKPRTKIAAEPRRRLLAGMRRYRRVLLLVVLPLVAALAGLIFYLNGGRYVTTDDAYVGAQKVLITPDVLCRRAEGSDHAGRLRQDRQCRGEGRSVGVER